MRGHIRKHGAGWQYTVELEPDPITGKRKQKSKGGFRTKKECEAAMNELINQIEKGEYFEVEKMTLKEYLEYWLDTYAKVNVAPRTYERYKELVNHINSQLGGMWLNQLKAAHIQRFYSGLIDDGKLSNSTILKIHRVFHEALKHATSWQMIRYNPVDAVIPPRAERKEMKVWDVDTSSKFLEAIKGTTIYVPVALALQTGMREGEICALKWENVNLISKTLSVVNTLQKIDKKLTLKEPKTPKSRRAIALMDATVQLLKEHHRKQAAVKLTSKEYNDQGFVCAWEDGRPYDPMYVCKKFSQLVKELDFPVIRFHDLRHTHATILLQQGVNPKIVSERLGHSNIGITLDTYSHVLPDMQREAAARLDEAFERQCQ